MIAFDKIIKTLANYKDPSIDHALSAALNTAAPQAASQIANALLQRHEPHTLEKLITHYHLWPDPIKQQIIAHPKQIYHALRYAFQSTNTQTLTNAIHILQETKSPHQAYLLNRALTHGSAAIKKQAAQALTHITAWALSTQPDQTPIPSADQFQAICKTILDAVKTYQLHNQEDVLKCYFKCAPALTQDVTQTKDPHHIDMIATPIKSALAHQTYPQTLNACIPLIDHPLFKHAALLGIRKASDQNNLQPILNTHHLLKIKTKNQKLQNLVDAKQLIPKPQHIAQYPDTPATGYIQWIQTLLGHQPWAIPPLKAAQAFTSSIARLHALKSLMQIAKTEKSQTAQKAILYFIADKNPHIALTAARYTVNQQHANPNQLHHILLDLLYSQHTPVRRFASRRLAPIGFDSLWTHWAKLTDPQKTQLGQTLVKIDPHFHHTLGKKLGSPNPQHTIKALNIITFLNQGDFFQQALTILLNSHNTKIVSAAASALSTSTSPQTLPDLEKCLANKNPRVRANAIESLNKRSPQAQLQTLKKIAQKDTNRPRANAIGALLNQNTQEALDQLTHMLHDHKPNHRTSALWLIQNMGISEMAKHVAEMAISDPDPTVKNKAQQVIQQILQQIQDTQNTHKFTG